MTLRSIHPVQWWLTKSLASTYVCRKCSSTSTTKTDMSTGKSTVTPLTPDTHHHYIHEQVNLADQVLPLEKMSMVEGVTLDTHLNFTQHRSKRVEITGRLCFGKQAITRQLATQCSPTAALSVRHHIRTQTGAGFKGHKIQHW